MPHQSLVRSSLESCRMADDNVQCEELEQCNRYAQATAPNHACMRNILLHAWLDVTLRCKFKPSERKRALFSLSLYETGRCAVV
jgi:hypothetical protein